MDSKIGTFNQLGLCQLKLNSVCAEQGQQWIYCPVLLYISFLIWCTHTCIPLEVVPPSYPHQPIFSSFIYLYRFSSHLHLPLLSSPFFLILSPLSLPPSQQILACCQGLSLEVWDVEQGKKQYSALTPTDLLDPPTPLIFRPLPLHITLVSHSTCAFLGLQHALWGESRVWYWKILQLTLSGNTNCKCTFVSCL